MASSPASSDLSDPPSVESDGEDNLSTAVPSSRPSVDRTHPDHDHLSALAPPPKKRKTAMGHAAADRAPSSVAPEDNNDDIISVSSDGYSDAPGSPTHDEYALRDEAQTQCLWRDCDYGTAINNDELVKHVQGTHCATGGPKKTKYVCEWGECQRKTSNHPSGYALKAHMRSHTKEKPYYCALPECDKSFTRSDALAKHMRTVHEPEPARGTTNDPTPPGKKPIKLKLSNNASAPGQRPPPTPSEQIPTHDEDGNPVTLSGPNDNINYIPAHHPITGQPGFMITYPPDIAFTAWESSIPADQLMRLLRRQLHWAQQENDRLKAECAEFEQMKKEEWRLKEILLEGVMEAELDRAETDGLLAGVNEQVRQAMDNDTVAARQRAWTGGEPAWRQRNVVPDDDRAMQDVGGDDEDPGSPPPTGYSAGGGFDGDADPYDNYLAERMREYEEREAKRSLQNTPQKARGDQQDVREADAVGALVGMSGM